MNKRVFVFLLFLFPALPGYSQVSWHAKAGMNFSRVSGWKNSDLKPGYQFGVGLDHYFNDHWGLQPSLMLISKGYKASGIRYIVNGHVEYGEQPENIDFEPYASYKMTENRIYFEIPVMLTYRFNISNNIKLVISGGGYAGYGIGGKLKEDDTLFKDGITRKTKTNTFYSGGGPERFDTGIAAGTTLEYNNKYTLGLIGEWGLKSTLGDYLKNQTYGLNIGYKF
ncbi:porin family protein [Parabacteroides sp. Marseille-P3160]|uniref:porin family protein n=1 Tax=Parabacteroides sp. Marseille-P3160 TaxID=1917887 RepID=UPI0009BB09AF|nr:porin family protein [Parabacteroides sp. Marseille-P3160]